MIKTNVCNIKTVIYIYLYIYIYNINFKAINNVLDVKMVLKTHFIYILRNSNIAIKNILKLLK